MSSRECVVVVELQNQWTRKSLHHSLIRAALRRGDVVERVQSLLQEARSRGVAVIHAPLVVDPHNKRGLFAYLSAGLFFRKGSKQAEIDERVYAPTDTVVTGRTSFDAFVDSDLDEQLRKIGAQRVFVLGFTTDQCVARTLRTAHRKGYDAVLVSDCSATISKRAQRRIEREFSEHCCRSESIWGGDEPIGG